MSASDISALESLRAADRLVPNAEWLRYRAVTEAMGPSVSPWIRVIRRGETVMGAVMGRLSRRRVQLRAGYLSVPAPPLRVLDVVYGGLVRSAQDPSGEELASEIWRTARSGVVDVVVIHNARRDHPAVVRLCERGAVGREQPHLIFRLGETYEATLAPLSSKHRYNLKRADRVLASAVKELRLSIVSRPEDVPRMVESAVAVTRRSYQGEMQVGFLGSPPQVAALYAEAHAGRLLCYLLEGESGLIAYQIGALYGRTYFLESTAFDPAFRAQSPGSVLMQRVFADLISRGAHEVDYGFGDAPYKRQFCTEEWQEVTLMIHGRTLGGLSAGFAQACMGIAERALRMGAPYAQGIKSKWRRRMERRAARRASESVPVD